MKSMPMVLIYAKDEIKWVDIKSIPSYNTGTKISDVLLDPLICSKDINYIYKWTKDWQRPYLMFYAVK